jgi:hypothetical protein
MGLSTLQGTIVTEWLLMKGKLIKFEDKYQVYLHMSSYFDHVYSTLDHECYRGRTNSELPHL